MNEQPKEPKNESLVEEFCISLLLFLFSYILGIERLRRGALFAIKII